MKESELKETRRAEELRCGDRIYVNNNGGEDIVFLVVEWGRSGDVMFFACKARGPDSSIYWNRPERVYIQLEANTEVTCTIA